jgi:hypothetical protein
VDLVWKSPGSNVQKQYIDEILNDSRADRVLHIQYGSFDAHLLDELRVEDWLRKEGKVRVVVSLWGSKSERRETANAWRSELSPWLYSVADVVDKLDTASLTFRVVRQFHPKLLASCEGVF